MRIKVAVTVGFVCLLSVTAGCLTSPGPEERTETTETIGPGLVIEDSYPHSFTVTVIDQATNDTILVRTSNSSGASEIDLTNEIGSSTETAVATITTANGTEWKRVIQDYEICRVTIDWKGSFESTVLED